MQHPDGGGFQIGGQQDSEDVSAVTGREFVSKVRRWAKQRGLRVVFYASEGPGSHGTLYVNDHKTTVKDRKKEIGKGLQNKMLADLGIDRADFQALRRKNAK